MGDLKAEQLALEIQTGLKSHLRLHREAAITKLERQLSVGASPNTQTFCTSICSHVAELLESSAEWQQRVGGFDAARVLIPAVLSDSPFLARVLSSCQSQLEDEEPRVRASVAGCVQALASRRGTAVMDAMGDQIIASIQAAFARDPVDTVRQDAGDAATRDFLGQLLQTSYRQQRPGEGELRHDTEGWRSLESSFHALQGVMEGCGPSFAPYLTPKLLQLILSSLLHQNRFVRERGYHVVQALLGVCSPAELHVFVGDVAAHLADGLMDSWPHVRYAASQATRGFLSAVEGYREEVLPVLLPAMCFNRHGSAEGLCSFSQQTWVQVMGTTGREWVARCIDQVVDFYLKQSRASNHEFREAACECMSELAAKIDRAAVQPHIPAMLQSLIFSLTESSWPVREAACEAAGQIAVAYPEEARAVLPRLYLLWLDHLQENVPAVRETAAMALGNAVRAFGDDAVQTLVPQAEVLLQRVREQPADDDKYVKTAYGVAAVRRNDGQVEQGDGLFGKPSLDPAGFGGKPAKLFSTSALTREPADCCMDQGFQRERQPWEATDGAVYLVRELAATAPSSLDRLMPLLASVVSLSHYAHACHLQETVWRQLPLIAQHLGKRGFKRYLEPFLEPLFRNVQSPAHQGCQNAAIYTAAFMRDWLGPRIFAGRLSLEQQQLMQQFVPTLVHNKPCFYVAPASKTVPAVLT